MNINSTSSSPLTSPTQSSPSSSSSTSSPSPTNVAQVSIINSQTNSPSSKKNSFKERFSLKSLDLSEQTLPAWNSLKTSPKHQDKLTSAPTISQEVKRTVSAPSPES